MLSIYDNFRLITHNIITHFDNKKENGFYEVNDLTIDDIIEKYDYDKKFKNEFITFLEKSKDFKKTTRHNIKEDEDESSLAFIKNLDELYIIVKLTNYKAHYLNQLLYLHQQLYKMFINIEYIGEQKNDSSDLFVLYKLKETDNTLIDFSISDIKELILNENLHLNRGI
jgi:hypothetical protein